MKIWTIVAAAPLAAVFIPQSVDAKSVDAAQVAYDHQDYATALKLWLPRAAHGEVPALLAVGDMYSKGTGVKRNYTMALKWLRKAAEKGSADAQDSVGWMYETGHGAAQDIVVGRSWFLRSANQGDADGIEHMAESYMAEGNETEIYFWYSLIARSNSNYAKYRDSEAAIITADQKATVDKRLEEWKPVSEPH
jgi:TPR repeat protein